MSTIMQRIRDALGDDGPLLERAMEARQEGGPLGPSIAVRALRMSRREIGEWITDDNRYVREGASGPWLQECEIRLAIMTAELERRDEAGID
jgi:hypothetical protein